MLVQLSVIWDRCLDLTVETMPRFLRQSPLQCVVLCFEIL
jgi:hypothetical protein